MPSASNNMRALPLAEGDLIRLVAPAGLFDKDRFERGVRIIEEQGFRAKYRPDVLETNRYMAGTDERRLTELQEAFDDTEARAVWAIRGGYGSMRLLPHLDTSRMLSLRKLFIGFSDVTAIHAILNRDGLVTLHGPMVAGLHDCSMEASNLLWRLVGNEAPRDPYEWEPPLVIRRGLCSGRLLGGNLSLLTRLLGTPFFPDPTGAILVIEEVGEAPYRVDRMLTHLELAGVTRRLSGVLIGGLTGCEAKDAAYSCLDVVADRVRSWGVPAITGFPIGHGDLNLPLPLGAHAVLDCGEGSLALEDSAGGMGWKSKPGTG